MVSLGILISGFIGTLLMTAWVVALTARAVGSSRGRFRVGLICVLQIAAVSIVIGLAARAVGASLPARSASPLVAVALISIAAQVWAILFLLRHAFALSLGQTFATFGVYLGMVLVQLVLALAVVRPFLAQPFTLRAASMSPTIEPGDLFLVSKVIQLRRWDLVAYRTNENGASVVFCKRLIALPGEQLRFDHGEIYINDKLVGAPAVLAGHCHASPGAVPAYRAKYKDGQTIVVGSDEYFFMGDNVDRSLDSRMSGPSTRSSLVGVVDLIYWPLGKVRIVR